jgi:hypothetical protein
MTTQLLRKSYIHYLIWEVHFQKKETFSSIRETYQESETSFFIHVAKKNHHEP